MPTTVNKNYEVQVTGTNTNLWGEILNEDVIEIVDRNLGGLVTKTLSNSPVVLTAQESQNLTLVLNGTLTGNVQITTAAVGLTIVQNATSGAFAVTFTNGVGTPVTIQQGTIAIVATDGTNGPRNAASNAPEFPSGTGIAFRGQTAPTGWTKDLDAALNNAAIRVVTGSSGGSTGGSLDFTTAFASRSMSGTVGGTALTIAQMPEHSHTYLNDPFPAGHPTGSGSTDSRGQQNQIYSTSTEGGGQSHNHSLSMTALNMAVKYVDMILCIKD